MPTYEELYRSVNPEGPLPLVARCHGDLFDLGRDVQETGCGTGADASQVEWLTGEEDDGEGLDVLRHSAAHLLAQAVIAIHPDAKPTIGPATETGFYYDFQMEPVAEEDLGAIEKKMKELSRANIPVERRIIPRSELETLFADNPFKLELIREHVEGDGATTAYAQGEFLDLCRGPHVRSTAVVRHFKLTTTSSCFWRGDDSRERLVRIYGTVFPSKSALKGHLKMMEEAKKRDHRVIGPKNDLFFIKSEVGPAFPLYPPEGTVVRNQLIEFMRKTNVEYGWDEVWTPQAFRNSLWFRSGHWKNYRDKMFPVLDPKLKDRPVKECLQEDGKTLSVTSMYDESDYALKPMNCPGHIQIFDRYARSYRDLPVRYSEFGTVYRYEQSGETSGLLRVRCLTQDDGHCFCRSDQVEVEVTKLIDMVVYVFRDVIGLTDMQFNVSTRASERKFDPDTGEELKYIGDEDTWSRATEALKAALEARGIPYKVKDGEAAFYGPKIDVDVKDCIGRSWQCSTVQLDFFMPKRFELTYKDAENQDADIIMIHRTIYGTLDRFMGILIEEFAGRFPTWLSPVQVSVIPISDDQADAAISVQDRLRSLGVRVRADLSRERMQKKIKLAQDRGTPYMLVIGKREAEEGTVSVRHRTGVQVNDIPLGEFIEMLMGEIDGRDREARVGTLQPPITPESDSTPESESTPGSDSTPGSESTPGSDSTPESEE